MQDKKMQAYSSLGMIKTKELILLSPFVFKLIPEATYKINTLGC